MTVLRALSRAPRSLIGQFALLHLATALIAAATLPFGVGVLLHHVARHYQREILGRQAAEVTARLRQDDPAAAILAADILTGGLTLDIVDRRHHVLAERGPSHPAVLAAMPLADHVRYVRRAPFAAISRPASDGWVVVSQNEAAPEVVIDDIVRNFLKWFGLLLLPIAVLVPLAGIWLTRRATVRMKAAAAIAETIGPRTLDRRLPRGTLPAEVEPLAAAANAALDRLEQTFIAQAAFAADIVHELRSPLAILRLRAEGVADPAAKTVMLAEIDRAARVVTQLLGLADLERPPEASCAPVDLLAIAEAVVSDRAAAVLRGGRMIALDDRGAEAVTGYGDALALALENLVDNAAKYPPAGTTMTVYVGPGPRIGVVDDGPPLDPEILHRMARRFWRAPGAQSKGSGLGLSIVERVAVAHGGRLSLAAGPDERGLDARLILADIAE